MFGYREKKQPKQLTDAEIEKIKKNWEGFTSAGDESRINSWMPKVPKKYQDLHLSTWSWGLYDRFVKSIESGKRLREMRVTTKYFSNLGLRTISNDQKKWFFYERGDDYAIVNYGVGSGLSYSTYNHNTKVIIKGVGVFNQQDTDEDIVQTLVPEHLRKHFTYSNHHRSEKLKKWKALGENK